MNGDSIFKDRLTKYSSPSVTYDEIGNPVNYFGKAMSWTGRTLDSIGTLTFTYDLNGIRNTKGNVEYLYNGT